MLFLGDFSVFLAATVAVFLIDEQDKPKRTTWLKPNGFQGPQRFEGVDDAGTVVVSAFADVPGVEVTTKGDDFIKDALFLAILQPRSPA